MWAIGRRWPSTSPEEGFHQELNLVASWTSSLQHCKKLIFVVYATQSMVFCYCSISSLRVFGNTNMNMNRLPFSWMVEEAENQESDRTFVTSVMGLRGDWILNSDKSVSRLGLWFQNSGALNNRVVVGTFSQCIWKSWIPRHLSTLCTCRNGPHIPAKG